MFIISVTHSLYQKLLLSHLVENNQHFYDFYRAWSCAPAILFFSTLICGVFLGQTGIFYEVQRMDMILVVHLLFYFFITWLSNVGLYISNQQLLTDHTTEINQICTFSLIGTKVMHQFYDHIDIKVFQIQTGIFRERGGGGGAHF